MKTIQFFLYILLLLTVATSCREDELVVPTEYDIIGDENRDSATNARWIIMITTPACMPGIFMLRKIPMSSKNSVTWATI